jgi:prefoldin subunit 5
MVRMPATDPLERIDQRLQSIDGRLAKMADTMDQHESTLQTALERSEAAWERSQETFERCVAAFDRFDRAFDDFRRREQDLSEFIREMTVRNERVLGALAKRIEDQHDASHAHTRAILALLDRLGLDPPPPRTA